MSMHRDAKRTVRRVFAWSFVVIWALVILGFSGQDGAESGELSNRVTQLLCRVFTGAPGNAASPEYRALHLLVRKAAHMTEYAVLSIGVQTALYQYALHPAVRAAGAGASCFLLAALDEWKQTLVEGRSGLFTDVLIDTGGALAGILLFLLFLSILERRRCRRPADARNE